MEAQKNTVLKAIYELQGDSNNYIADTDIAESTGIEVVDVRGYMDVLEDEDALQSANSHDGHRAHLYPKHKVRAKTLLKETIEQEQPNISPIEEGEEIPGWYQIKKLGEGGQGKVFLVRDERNISNHDLSIKAANTLKKLSDLSHPDNNKREEAFNDFKEIITEINSAEDLSRLGALKILHRPEEARSPELAQARIKKEITAMQEVRHPNLLPVVDVDPYYRWYVSQYQPFGDLTSNLGIFAGDVLKSLKTFRALIDGVAALHQKGYVHRDIKPENIFLGANQQLLLGDFGLVILNDEEARLSNTHSNLGSRDWMPAWAQTLRVEEVKPTFDVFSLGKVLWSMVSGKPKLRLWYFEDEEHPDFNVENIFPNDPNVHRINALLRKCVVERERDCLADASALLVEVDKAIADIETNNAFKAGQFERKCMTCSEGNYQIVADQEDHEVRNFGLSPRGANTFKIYRCDICGHIQLFSFLSNEVPPAWNEKTEK